MSYLISKYKGTYRLLTEFDKTTNDFPRDLAGNFSDNDIYIKCANKIKVFYVGKGVMECYIPSLGRGHNILIKLTKELLDKEASEFFKPDTSSVDYDKLYESLIESKKILNIVESDSEIIFQFDNKLMDSIMPVLQPTTSGASISPFSSKNLPKSTYTIPSEELEAYKNLTSKLPKSDALKLGHITNNFIKSLSTRSKSYDSIKVEMKKNCIKGKEYIHYCKKWKEYIKYLETEVNTILATK